MDDRKIQVFLSVVEHGSFSRASEHLHCTQSAVTQTMNRLEDEIGCALIHRRHNGVKLTAEGEALLNDFQQAQNSLQLLKTHAEQLAKPSGRKIRIGAFSSVANTWLPEILRSFGKKYPEIEITLKICTGELEQLLLQDQIDLALGDEMRLSHVEFTPLMEDPYYAALPEQMNYAVSSVTQQELAKLPFLMAPMNALSHVLSTLPEKSLEVDCDDDVTLLNLVAGGLGCTVMPALSLSVVPEQVSILPIVPEIFRTIGMGLTEDASEETKLLAEYILKNQKVIQNTSWIRSI